MLHCGPISTLQQKKKQLYPNRIASMSRTKLKSKRQIYWHTIHAYKVHISHLMIILRIFLFLITFE